MTKKMQKNILWLKEIRKQDVPLVGGKNASLGEMYSNLSKKKINIPNAFATTSKAYWYYLEYNNIKSKLEKIFKKFNPESLSSLRKTGRMARELIIKGDFPDDLKQEIVENYRKLSKEYKRKNLGVAVRSSATAEDLPSASFAGQHESYLNVINEKELLKATKKCIASLFTDRAIIYREEKGFKHLKIALSVCVQKMVRSDLSSSGILFTIDTESGFDKVVLINSTFGIGEMIVKGRIIPDEFYVFKPTLEKGFKSIITKSLGKKNKKYIYSKKGGLKEVKVSTSKQNKFSLTDEEVLKLAKWAVIIENYYKRPQDIEWAKDGKTKELYIVQSRPETVHASLSKKNEYKKYKVNTNKKPILTGIAIGSKISTGKVRIISNVSESSKFKKGEILVTKMTDPDWIPLMRVASGIITEQGGKTSHAAIVSRELGIPCIIGTETARKVLQTGKIVTIDCTQGGKGRIYSGKISFKVKKYNLKNVSKIKTKVMLNLGSPEIAFKNSFLPNDGIGLTRQEFIIAENIKIHPLALYNYEKIKDKKLKAKIDKITIGYDDKKQYFIDKLSEGISKIAAAFYPKRVILRLSDFKTNEYRNLIGGDLFEKEESNPMLGFRGASRYLDKGFQPAFKMECKAIKKARDIFGLKNIWIMVPFCRTIKEGNSVLKLLASNGLKKGKDLKVIVMCEIPSNVILGKEFLDIFDGMSIGTNDLTQLVLGIDRDNSRIAHVGNERDQAVKEMVKSIISITKKKKKYCGICGEAASIPEFTKFLIDCGIESISVVPDSIIKTILIVDKQEKHV